MEKGFCFRYEIGVTDEFGDMPITYNRYDAFELAKYYANEDKEPVTITVTVNGSARPVCELTIYPDMKEE